MLAVSELAFAEAVDAEESLADTLHLSEAALLAQQPVRSIRFSGGFRTRRFILQREIDTRVGDQLDLKRLDRDRRKLFSLGIYSEVEPYLTSFGDSVEIDFRIKEVWTLLPRISVTETDGRIDWSVGLVEKDFLGLYAQTAVQYRRFEEKNSIYLGAVFSRLLGKDISIGFAASDQRENDPLTFAGVTGNYDYRHKWLSGQIGKRLHDQVYVSLISGYDRENWRLRRDSEGIPAATMVDNPRYNVSGVVTVGRVYYDRFFYDGSDITNNFALINEQPEGTFSKWRNSITARLYRVYHRFNLASRLRIRTSSRDERVRPYSISGDVNVRGYPDKIRRGDHLVSSNLEIRMRAIETGLIYSQISAFTDYGVIWGRYTDFSDQLRDPFWSVGIGLRGALKSYLANVGRIDLALSPRTGEWTLYIASHQFF